MKKILIVLSVFLLFLFVSCDEAKPEPAIGEEITVADLTTNIQAIEQMKILTLDMEMSVKRVDEEVKTTLYAVIDVQNKKMQYKMNKFGNEMSITYQLGKVYASSDSQRIYCNSKNEDQKIADLMRKYASPSAMEVPLESIENAYLNEINVNEKVYTYKGATSLGGKKTYYIIRCYLKNNKMVKLTGEFTGGYESKVAIYIKEEANFSEIVEEDYIYSEYLEERWFGTVS